MGDYTGFRIKVLLRPDTPEEVIEVLKRQIEWKKEPFTGKIPNHSLFDEGDDLWAGWKSVLCMQAAYQKEYEAEQPPVEERLTKVRDYWQLYTSSAPKWGRGIQEFLDWIHPYVDPSEYGVFVGHHKSEYTNNRTWVAFNRNGIAEMKENINEEDW